MSLTQVELIRELEKNHTELFKAVEPFNEAQINKIPVVEQWTTKDIVGHIAYWE